MCHFTVVPRVKN